jgi:hypothetical protein
MADKYVALDTTSGRLKQTEGTVTSSGSGQAGKIVALDSSGKLDPSVVPAGAGGESVQSITATEAMDAGAWVNIYNNAGSPAIRKALAQDTTKNAHGFIKASVGAGSPANVYKGGDNDKIPVGSFGAADIGKMVFLSAATAGASTLTPPSGTGQLIQPLGKIVNIDATYITVDMDLGMEIVV